MTDNNQIQAFDPTTLMDGVRDRIKSTFVSLIPEDKWEELVHTEIDKFFVSPELQLALGKGAWEQKVIKELTPFSRICQALITEEATNRMKKYLESDQFKIKYDAEGRPIMESAVQEFIKLHAASMFANMLTSGISSQMQALSYQINHPTRY